MKCAEADAFVDAYVDGELAGVDRDAYEQHLLHCDRCSHGCRFQSRFKAAVRGHLPPRPAPEGLRRSIEAAIASAPPPPRRWRWQLWPKLVPTVVVAGALGTMLFSTRGKPPVVLHQAMRMFNTPLPMDVVGKSCADIAGWFRGKVDFAVKPPPEVGARCEGGRVLNVHDRLAAYFTLQGLHGHKLGMMVFDGDDEEEIQAPQRRVVNGIDLYMATYRGASAAAFRHWDGLTYVVTGDLDAESLTNFVRAAFRQ